VLCAGFRTPASDDLANDVIEQWLLKLANRGADTGWPPPEPLGRHAWNDILAEKPLS
jgi:hypothetical protein